MSEKWRLFIAIKLPPNVLSGLGQLQDQLIEQTPPRLVRWVKPQGIHLTLKFLGDVPTIRRDSLQNALAAAAKEHSGFELATGELGCFPNLRRPRVVWVDIPHDVAPLAALYTSLEKHIASLGFPTETRPFNPHLTLGRVRRDANRSDASQLGALIGNTRVDEVHRWQVTEVSLLRSELKPSGAVYTTLFDAPLKKL
jgi:2'-5' RNA ligase